MTNTKTDLIKYFSTKVECIKYFQIDLHTIWGFCKWLDYLFSEYIEWIAEVEHLDKTYHNSVQIII